MENKLKTCYIMLDWNPFLLLDIQILAKNTSTKSRFQHGRYLDGFYWYIVGNGHTWYDD